MTSVLGRAYTRFAISVVIKWKMNCETEKLHVVVVPMDREGNPSLAGTSSPTSTNSQDTKTVANEFLKICTSSKLNLEDVATPNSAISVGLQSSSELVGIRSSNMALQVKLQDLQAKRSRFR